MSATRNKVKAVLKNPLVKEDCFVDGAKRASGECPGIPKSNRCAACRMKKNYLNVTES